MDEVSAELSSTEDNPRENNCRKVFVISPKYDNLHTTTFTPETVHAVISVIHEKVYDIIQIEVSRKKLKSSTSVASSSSKTETQRGKRQGVFYRFGGAAPNRVSKPRKQTLALEK